MFGWFKSKKKVEELEENTKKGFDFVKKDLEGFKSWIKHLDSQDKRLFDILNELRIEISSIKDDLNGVKEAVSFADLEKTNKQLFKKTGVFEKQTAVYGVQEPVQTPVQTGNFYDILKNLSANERLLILTLLNSGDGMKLSYEDLARLLGKERSTVRGQINAIKQKSEGLIEELVEPNGKKRVFIREEVRNKLLKYAKVRVGSKKKDKKKEEKEAN